MFSLMLPREIVRLFVGHIPSNYAMFLVKRSNINTINGDEAFGDFIKSWDEIDQCRFTTTSRTNKRGCFTSFAVKVI
jgi:hypothetical protein